MKIYHKITSNSLSTPAIKELWEYKELLYFFTWRDIKVKYKQTLLGFSWVIIQPICMMLIFYYIFGRNMQMVSKGIPYPIFSLSGLILWNVFSSGITGSGNSLVTNANILKKIYFPRLIIPLSSILVSVFDFIISFSLFFIAVIILLPETNLLLLILCMLTGLLICTLTTIGLGTLLGAMNIKYRDFRYVIPFLVQFLLFASPVIYPLNMIENDIARYLLAANPISTAIEVMRYPFSNNLPNEITIIISLSCMFLLLFGGLFYFKNTEAYFADIA